MDAENIRKYILSLTPISHTNRVKCLVDIAISERMNAEYYHKLDNSDSSKYKEISRSHRLFNQVIIEIQNITNIPYNELVYDSELWTAA